MWYNPERYKGNGLNGLYGQNWQYGFYIVIRGFSDYCLFMNKTNKNIDRYYQAGSKWHR